MIGLWVCMYKGISVNEQAMKNMIKIYLSIPTSSLSPSPSVLSPSSPTIKFLQATPPSAIAATWKGKIAEPNPQLFLQCPQQQETHSTVQPQIGIECRWPAPKSPRPRCTQTRRDNNNTTLDLQKHCLELKINMIIICRWEILSLWSSSKFLKLRCWFRQNRRHNSDHFFKLLSCLPLAFLFFLFSDLRFSFSPWY